MLDYRLNNNANIDKTKSIVEEPEDGEASEADSEVVLSQNTRDQRQIQRLELELNENSRKMEEKLDKLTDALVQVQDLVKKTGKRVVKQGRVTAGTGSSVGPAGGAESATTIYQNAIQPIDQVSSRLEDLQVDETNIQQVNRLSSSSEEMPIDTSDEMMDISQNEINFGPLHFPVETAEANNQMGTVPSDQPQPSTSSGRRGGGYSAPTAQFATAPKLTRSAAMIRESEASKIRTEQTPGKGDSQVPMSYLQAVYADEEYLVMGSHLEQSTIQKIINHEFIDFGKLLPRDRLQVEEEDHQRMELVNKNGMTFWSPIKNRDATNGITNFSRWETAFRVFSNIYTTHYPLRLTELLQYAHVIYTASLTYVWENVYLYDREFRFHMSRHPQRNWSVILQQAWNLRLKDKIKHESFNGDRSKPKSNDICKRFNRGKCNLGASCQFVHKCFGCGKFGHGVHICRRKSNGDSPAGRNRSPGKNKTPAAVQSFTNH